MNEKCCLMFDTPPPPQWSWKSMRMLWCRCYYSTSLSLLKNSLYSFVFVSAFLLRYSFEPLSSWNVKCFVQKKKKSGFESYNRQRFNHFGVTHPSILTNVTGTCLLFCFLFYFLHLWHISDLDIYKWSTLQGTGASWKMRQAGVNAFPAELPSENGAKKARLYSTFLGSLACCLHCWRTTLRR